MKNVFMIITYIFVKTIFSDLILQNKVLYVIYDKILKIENKKISFHPFYGVDAKFPDLPDQMFFQDGVENF